MAEAKAYKMIPHCTKDTITYEMDELIRCKDCKHGRIYYRDHVACDIIEHPSHGLDWFCADGERKERGETDE